MHKVYTQMKGYGSLNTKITMSMLAAMIVFKINEVKGHNNVFAHVTFYGFVDAISLIINILYFCLQFCLYINIIYILYNYVKYIHLITKILEAEAIIADMSKGGILTFDLIYFENYYGG